MFWIFILSKLSHCVPCAQQWRIEEFIQGFGSGLKLPGSGSVYEKKDPDLDPVWINSPATRKQPGSKSNYQGNPDQVLAFKNLDPVRKKPEKIVSGSNRQDDP